VIGYIGRRVFAAVPSLAVVLLLSFGLLHILPGDPAAVIAGDQATATQIENIRVALHLDEPLPVQFVSWVGGILHGNFGTSVITGESMTALVGQRLPATLSLAFFGEAIAIAVGLPLGIVAARSRNSWVDRAVIAFAVLGFSFPTALVAYVLILVFSLGIGLLPPTGYQPVQRGLFPALPYLVLPSLTIGLSSAAIFARMTRAAMLEVLQQEYMRTAHAKGLNERTRLVRHAWKNAAIPVVTVVGISVANVLAGAIVVETIFAIPGIGRLFIDSVNNRDYTIVQGCVLLTGFFFVAINLIVDLSYVFLDPRIRY
jgi:peptide/nickel transport system permease protein